MKSVLISAWKHLRVVALLMVMLPVATAWAQEPVELTTDENSNGVYDNSEKKLYLIQTLAFQSFYMAPQANSTVTTNNIMGDYLLWYFLDAGTANDTQYYYIVNNSTDKYIYNHNGNSRGISIITSAEFDALSDANKEKCKFKLVVDNSNGTTGFYNIDVRTNQTYYGLNKQNGSQANTYPIRLTNNQYIHDPNSKWKFIPYNGTFTWPTPPFTVSTDFDKHYYKIHNLQNNTYYVSTDATPDKVTFASTESNNMVWYLKEAGSDTWYKYYYLVNPEADKYMYYNGTAIDGSDQTNAVSVRTYDSGDDDRYRFVVVQAARGDGASSVECYAIIPKLLNDKYWSSNSIGPKGTIVDGLNMGIITSRGANNTAQWQFNASDYPLQCAAPTITYSSATGKITITSTTPGTTIYYTTDGTQPSSSNGNTYSSPFDVSAATTVKAIATKTGYRDSEVTTKSYSQVATPSIQDNGSNAISITCATDGATIYYTTDGNTPTTSSSVYSSPLTENVSGVTIKAIAVKEGLINSTMASGSVMFQCARPFISKVGNNVTISCSFPTSGVSIYYTTDGSTPTSTSTLFSGSFSAVIGDVIKAIAIATNYYNSEVTEKTIREELSPIGGIYYINNDDDFETFVDMANEYDGSTYHYELTTNVNAAAAITQPFIGIFDGAGHTITGLSHPLFNTVDGGVVKNIFLKGVAISSSEDTVGAIACIAKGYSRIYNCGILPNSADFPSGTHPYVITSGNCAGGLVGNLRDDSRVINCYSYADVQAVSIASGIVGRNNYASTTTVTDGKYADLRTAIVNNLFYGDILGGSNQYGVYGGELITNATTTGISSYNYYSNGSTFSTLSGEPTAYNCTFPADVRYLTQVEFHRSLLNSNRELCGWWVGSNVAPRTLTTAQVQAIAKDASLMYKWVVDPDLAPYPILKPFGKYPSVVNGNTGTPWFDRTTANPYEGKQLGTLRVTVKSGSQSSAADQVLDIPITDMDTLHYDFGYRKIQLPYFNTVFGDPEGATWAVKYAGNYTDYVVTGWKVTAVTGGTQGTFLADWQDGYNFANRKCTDKDKYDVSGRVFAQGGNYYVPDSVTAITIEAYWGKAIYVRNADASYDRVNITSASTGTHFAPAGTRGNNVNGHTIQTTTIAGTLTNANIDAKKTVYDYALVLVGNVQESRGGYDVKHGTQDTRGFTIMSVDLDFDEEPDYCLEWQLGAGTTRQIIAPIRFDFLPVVELGIAGKLNGSTNFFSLGCYRSKGHFEVTETSFIRFGQFEFELETRDDGPIILNGGIFDQYTRGRNKETNQHITYVIVGGHLVMPSFTPGAHIGASYQTRHCAVNALGGDFTSFYLTGGYREDVNPYDDSAKCYIDGGRFGTIAAAYKEGIKGNVVWRINHALIGEFYGGGMMSEADKVVKGNIDVVIDSSVVRKYCGGPKFGDMVSGKTVTTRATGTTFGEYYGAGNGGTNYVQFANDDKSDGPRNASQWLNLLTSSGTGKYSPRKYISTAKGYHANYDYEEINPSTGTTSGQMIDRIYYYSAQFATTNTGNVSSTLTGCTVLNNFYGAGFLGGVVGTVTSILTDCDIHGSAFGAGYSASVPKVNIYNTDKTPPKANIYTGIITPQSGGTFTTYTWCDTAGSTGSPVTHDTLFYTEVSLDNLGTVSSNDTLIIKGNSKIGTRVDDGAGHQVLKAGTGNVYGGGDESSVGGNTFVSVEDNTVVLGSVFGGGNQAPVNANTEVVVKDKPLIYGNVYGGGNMGVVGGDTKVIVNGN